MIRSILVGLGLPICSCGVVPIAIGLHRKGAPVGSTLAFLIAAPAMSPAAAFTMWMLLGPKLAAAYLVSVAVTALAVGLVANVLFPTPDAPVGSSHERSLCTPAPAREPVIIARFDRHNLGRMLRYAFHDYGAEVSFDILFGLLLATVVDAKAASLQRFEAESTAVSARSICSPVLTMDCRIGRRMPDMRSAPLGLGWTISPPNRVASKPG